jgi:crossover junction endodeoxyribonuclease RuvC
MRVIGVDPGLQKTGYAIVEKTGNSFSVITSGVVKTPKSTTGKRLLCIHKELAKLIDTHKPIHFAIEAGFYSKNVDSLVKMSQVKGVAMLAAALRKIEIFEYSPTTIKSAIVGRGSASKDQVRFMVEQMLNMKIAGSFDISDALAVAICHLQRM